LYSFITASTKRLFSGVSSSGGVPAVRDHAQHLVTHQPQDAFIDRRRIAQQLLLEAAFRGLLADSSGGHRHGLQGDPGPYTLLITASGAMAPAHSHRLEYFRCPVVQYRIAPLHADLASAENQLDWLLV
jgi:hypothetical protein